MEPAEPACARQHAINSSMGARLRHPCLQRLTYNKPILLTDSTLRSAVFLLQCRSLPVAAWTWY